MEIMLVQMGRTVFLKGPLRVNNTTLFNHEPFYSRLYIKMPLHKRRR